MQRMCKLVMHSFNYELDVWPVKNKLASSTYYNNANKKGTFTKLVTYTKIDLATFI